jgi:hypothetical protein
MKKWYRKTELTQFEQFDGSEKMQGKYRALPDGPDTFIFWTTEGDMLFKKGDWIATGVNGEHWAVKDDVFQKTYEETQQDCKYCHKEQPIADMHYKDYVLKLLDNKLIVSNHFDSRGSYVNYCPICGRKLTNE